MAVLISDLLKNLENVLKSKEIYTIILKAVEPTILMNTMAEALTCTPAIAKEVISDAGYGYLYGENKTGKSFISFCEDVLQEAFVKFGRSSKSLLRESVSFERQIKRLDSVLRNSINSEIFLKELSNNLHTSLEQTAEMIKSYGAGDISATGYAIGNIISSRYNDDNKTIFNFLPKNTNLNQSIPHVTVGFSKTEFNLSKELSNAVSLLFSSLQEIIEADSLPGLYRQGIMDYYDQFQKEMAPKIDEYISASFGKNKLKYVINSGIGANEQANHALAMMNNHQFIDQDEKGKYWLMANSPAELERQLYIRPDIAKDISQENTLFMEFSRSGKTEETIKLHEFTLRSFKRIVFANSGPLRAIAERDNNLIFDLPDDVSGRYGFARTPILLAPMHVIGMDTKLYWQSLDKAAVALNLSKPDSLPVLMAKFIYLSQRENERINQIYFGIDHGVLALQGDSLIQFWNEGVNKMTNLQTVNDIIISRFAGLPRDAHFNLEAFLSNAKSKIGIFMIYGGEKSEIKVLEHEIDAIDQNHAGIKLGQEEVCLSGANSERFIELGMPTIMIKVDSLDVQTLAYLNMFFADITLVYSKLYGIDPGSNPEVKYVRDRSAKTLISAAEQNYDILSPFVH